MAEIKIMSTSSPVNRPPFSEWVKEMRIGGIAYYTHEDGKQKADEIMKGVGIEQEELVIDDLKNFFTSIWKFQ